LEVVIFVGVYPRCQCQCLFICRTTCMNYKEIVSQEKKDVEAS